MKINFIILLILLLTVSLGNAQSEKNEKLVIETSEVSSVEDNNKQESVEKDGLLIDNEKFQAIMARTTSDIRSYLNRERNISNIGLMFPSMEKRVKA